MKIRGRFTGAVAATMRQQFACSAFSSRTSILFRVNSSKSPKGVKCPAIDGIIAEADELAAEVADKQVLDAAIVGSAQAVEHYEIAVSTLVAWADELGRDDIVRLLTTNLNEEKAARLRSCPEDFSRGRAG